MKERSSPHLLHPPSLIILHIHLSTPLPQAHKEDRKARGQRREVDEGHLEEVDQVTGRGEGEKRG